MCDGSWPLPSRAIWQTPLPHLESRLDRALVRLCAVLAARQVEWIGPTEPLLHSADPFILALNHSSRREVVYTLALLLLIRGGAPIPFLADWNFRLIPGVAYLYEHSGAITVWRKPAKPAFLNRFKPTGVADATPFELARARLVQGGSVALFPEGTINRGAHRLLAPRPGVARLAIATQRSVLPVGIRYQDTTSNGALIDTSSRIEIRIGSPMSPPEASASDRAAANAFKAAVMQEIGNLCGKSPA